MSDGRRGEPDWPSCSVLLIELVAARSNGDRKAATSRTAISVSRKDCPLFPRAMASIR
jgi:hypothetical protein